MAIKKFEKLQEKGGTANMTQGGPGGHKDKRIARRQFFEEMKHEGTKMTPLGRKMERKSYRKSRNGQEYHKLTMMYFSGNKSEEGKYWTKKRGRRGRKGGNKSKSEMRVIRRHKKNDNCYAFNIKRNDGSEFWKVLTSMPEGENQRDRDEKIIAAKGGKIFKDVSEVDNWCESQQGNRERRGRSNTKSGKPMDVTVAEPVASGKEYQFTKEEEREKYLQEMAHEGYELTPAGKAEMKRAFVESNNPHEFRRIVYNFHKYGEKYVVRNSKKGSANMEMAAEYCSRDSGTKAGDWFARY